MTTIGDYGQGDGTLTRAAALVAEAKLDFNSLSSSLSSKISQMQGAWGGQGAAAFFTLHRTWTDKQNDIVRALDELADSLTLTERHNVANDEQQAASMQRLLGKLG